MKPGLAESTRNRLSLQLAEVAGGVIVHNPEADPYGTGTGGKKCLREADDVVATRGHAAARLTRAQDHQVRPKPLPHQILNRRTCPAC
ncbi:uncharacterized protein ColSpa_06071 [Colletotrichum spaethianum]|uniref:Uncharacterized protein n=1 Tax=Colletotrichum spaethianum TaxID=700344 RepID=A0AA37P0P7_9PEZI|nr:uncharacterized protein ColSpa_06071 [Colletotrichum spaethianum]GKT45890.1 hypothetical protein ColSpa_06071 [Colletotrichum spaethianum]